MKKPTVVEIAKQAGVSPTLVSFVVNNNEKHLARMNDGTIERVRKVAAELGYHRNELFAAARRGRSRFVALLARNVTVEYYARVLDHIMVATDRFDYAQKLVTLRESDQIPRAVTRIQEYRICGGIFLGVRNDILKQFWKQFGDASFPSLLVNCDPTQVKQGVLVSVDDKAAMRQAIDYLKGLGHRRIAYAGPTKNEYSHIARRKAFDAACADGGISASSSIALPWDMDDPQEELVAALKAKRRPTAIVAYSDPAALTVQRVSTALGLHIPADLSVVGFDDVSFAERLTPALTTFRQELAVIRDKYVPEYLESIESDQPLNRRKKRTIPTHLIERESTGPVR
ncbi:HTH-type transcriptional regulator DegA [Pontiella desulfatans]|uniref:HTH-type transcriptional regulator DegA n=1 Tax=Pontiella desulfatans TaxID=2750659 RepID=A0A6C2U564_PONDE|nr:LacI family DNA-binding transcriptional regulator [Pontiella desulfatans]VGO15130.1 HTH-type transcriptional regulator DegA [Pontiella desulfatans]